MRQNPEDENRSIESLLFDFVDRCKFLFFPEQWNQLFLDFSKNDIFTLLFVYRKRQVNVTEIAEYLKVPLNTVTGVISRLEKKELILRERSREDKRVVTVSLSDLGQRFLAEEIKQIGRYYTLIMEEMSSEETALIFQVIEKIFRLLNQDIRAAAEKDDFPKKIKRISID